jgi:hypothetical protein
VYTPEQTWPERLCEVATATKRSASVNARIGDDPHEVTLEGELMVFMLRNERKARTPTSVPRRKVVTTAMAVLATMLAAAVLNAQNAPPTSLANKSSGTAWKQEPTGWRDVKFGTPLKDVLESFGLVKEVTETGKCENQLREPVQLGDRRVCIPCRELSLTGDFFCEQDVELTDDINLLANLWFTEEKRRFHWMSGVFLSRNWDFVKAVLIERYGRPHRFTRPVLQNAFGAIRQNETLIWTGKHVVVEASKYSDNADQGSLTILPHSARMKSKRFDELKKKAAGKL